MNRAEHVTLTNIARGMVPQLFQREYEKVLENIKDTRVSATRQRKITIEIIVTPDEERHVLTHEVRASCKLPEAAGAKGFAFTTLDSEGNVIATLNDPEQLSLIDQLEEKQRKMGEK